MLHKVSPRTQRGCSRKSTKRFEIEKKRVAGETKSGVGEKRKDDGKWRQGREREFVCLKRGGGACQSVPSPALQRSPHMPLPLCPSLLNSQDSVTQDCTHTHTHTHTHTPPNSSVCVLLSSQIFKASGLQESSGMCDCASAENRPGFFFPISNSAFWTAWHFRCHFQRSQNQGCVGWFGFCP